MTAPLDTPASVVANVLQGLVTVLELAQRGTLDPALLTRCLARWQQQLAGVLALLERPTRRH